jgi:DNA-directed RNA polymerase specialized sigma24 family protein
VNVVARRAEPVIDEAWVVATLHEHSVSMLSLARRHSLCVDDAEDAYQRAVEIFLRRADTVRHETAPSWLRTVVKHTYDRRPRPDH